MEHIVLQKQDCIDIVNAIFTNDWDEKDVLICGNYSATVNQKIDEIVNMYF